MQIKVIFLQSDKSFSRKDRNEIKKIILVHARKAARALKFKEKALTFTVYPWKRDGVHAFTQARNWVRITINPAQFSSKKKRFMMVERLIYIVYHEMSHAARGYAGFLPKKKFHTLMNSIVSEGLADTFSREQYPSGYALKALKYNLKQVKKWLPKLKKIKWRRETFEDPWLMGGEGKPKKLGYKIGRYIIENAKNSKPKLTATTLTKEDAKKILKLSRVKI